MISEHCARVRARLDELQDGALAPLEAARDDGHLEACAGCAQAARARADWLADVRAALAPAPASQRDADARVAQALAAAAIPERRSTSRRSASRRAAAALLLAAAALVLLTLLPALPGGDSTLRAWSEGARVALAPLELPPVDWNPQALAPRTGH